MTNPSSTMPDTLQPTYTGFVRSSRDVCLLLEVTLSGRLPHVPRRPHERERAEIVKSGNIFIYEETASGVRRWTDGVNWSPSRILGNFLIYRETEPGFPGEGGKKTALKRNRGSNGSKPTGIRKNRSSPNAAMPATLYTAGNQPGTYGMGENELSAMDERDLYGSLIDSYPFKPGGLVKKTITVTVEGVPHHLVSYYKAEDVLSGKLQTPSMDPAFLGIQPRDSLLRNNTFRVPVEQEEYRINENSEAYITQDQAQMQRLYQPQQGYPPRALSMHSSHGLPEHGLPTGGMPAMPGYGQSSFSFPAQQQLTAQAATTPLTGGIQGLGQDMEVINGGHYQQSGSQGFGEGQETYLPNGFHSGTQRQLTYPSSQSGVFTAPPAQTNVYAPPPTPGYTETRAYRHASIAGAQNGYVPVVQTGSAPNPSPTSRDVRDPTALEGDHGAGAVGWPIDYQNHTQGFSPIFSPSDLPLRRTENSGIEAHQSPRAQALQRRESSQYLYSDLDGTSSTVETAGPVTPSVSPGSEFAFLHRNDLSRPLAYYTSGHQAEDEMLEAIGDLSRLPEAGHGGLGDALGLPDPGDMYQDLAADLDKDDPYAWMKELGPQ